MRAEPLVSVCIPCYNHAAFLPATIESVLAQTYRSFEIVIVDDGSPDESLAVARRYEAAHPDRVRVFTHPGGANRGISATVNLAFEHSRGAYWCGLPSDDLLHPARLERQVAVLEADPGVGLVYGPVRFVDDSGGPLPGTWDGDLGRYPDPVERLVRNNIVAGMTVMARRECMERVGPHETDLVYSDWEFWVRFFALYRGVYLDEPLVFYRMHGYNTSSGRSGHEVELDRGIAVLDSLRTRAPSVGGALARPRTRALIELQAAYLRHCRGDAGGAAGCLAAAWQADPPLAGDAAYLREWLLGLWELPFRPLTADEGTGTFALWVLRRLPPGLAPGQTARLRRQVEARQAWAGALAAWQAGDRARTRRCAAACLRRDWRWMGNRAFRSVLAESVIGAPLMSALRRARGA